MPSPYLDRPLRSLPRAMTDIMQSQLIPNRAELLAEVKAEIGDTEEAEWLVDHVLLPSFRAMAARTAARILAKFCPTEKSN